MPIFIWRANIYLRKHFLKAFQNTYLVTYFILVLFRYTGHQLLQNNFQNPFLVSMTTLMKLSGIAIRFDYLQIHKRVPRKSSYYLNCYYLYRRDVSSVEFLKNNGKVLKQNLIQFVQRRYNLIWIIYRLLFLVTKYHSFYFSYWFFDPLESYHFSFAYIYHIKLFRPTLRWA